MPASAVRPELGPSLPALLAPLPRWVRAALAAVVVLAVVLVAAAQLRSSADVERLVVEEPVAFNVAVPGGLERRPPPAGAVLAYATPAGAPAAQSFVAEPLRLPAYEGDPTAVLMQIAGRRADALRAALPGFVLRQEGRTRVNEQPGYQVLYQHRDGGRTAYGRLVLLVAAEEVDAHPREGVALDLRTQRSPAVPNVGQIGNNGALKTALRSFRLGTEAP